MFDPLESEDWTRIRKFLTQSAATSTRAPVEILQLSKPFLSIIVQFRSIRSIIQHFRLINIPSGVNIVDDPAKQ